MQVTGIALRLRSGQEDLQVGASGPLASVCAEAASLLQLLLDVTCKYGRSIRLLLFIDCLVLLDILLKWGTHNFHPRPKEN